MFNSVPLNTIVMQDCRQAKLISALLDDRLAAGLYSLANLENQTYIAREATFRRTKHFLRT